MKMGMKRTIEGRKIGRKDGNRGRKEGFRVFNSYTDFNLSSVATIFCVLLFLLLIVLLCII